MHTFVQKQNHSQDKASFNVSRSNQIALSKSHQLGPIRDLQRIIGNQATQQLLLKTEPHGLGDPSYAEAATRFGHDFSQIPLYPESRTSIQAKLTVNTPGDIYEHEADRIADQAIGTSDFTAASNMPSNIQRFSLNSNMQIGVAPASVEQVLASPGRPLEPALREDMELRLGHDFSRVQVHTGIAAEQSARDVNARAYTAGCNIVFDAGQFAPGTRQGKRLIAHELAHVMQQSGAEANVVRRSNGFEDEPTLEWERAGTVVEPSPPGSPRGVAHRPGGSEHSNVVEGTIERGTPPEPKGGFRARLGAAKSGFVEGFRGAFSAEGIASEIPGVILSLADKAAAREAIRTIQIKFAKEGFAKGVAAGAVGWSEDEVSSNLKNRITPFRVQGMEDPAGFLTRAYILQLAEAYENYAVDLGYEFSSSKTLKWKKDLQAKGFAVLAKYGYHFGQDPQVLFEYNFIEKLAGTLHPITDPIIDDAIEKGEKKRAAAQKAESRKMKRESGCVGMKC